MKKWLLSLTGLFLISGLLAQNTIGLPRINNFNKVDYHGGTQTWDIDQDREGRMFFANNEGLISFDGTFWQTHPLPNKTVVRSLLSDSTGRIYVGGQGEIGYFEPDDLGFLRFHSILNLIPANRSKFADIWDIISFRGAVFFRASDRIFEYSNNSVRVYMPQTEWVFMEKTATGLYAQDRDKGFFYFNEKGWHPVKGNTVYNKETFSGMVAAGKDSTLVVTIKKKFFLLHKDSLQLLPQFLKTPLQSDIFKTIRVNENEFALGTTSDGCLVVNLKGELIQRITRGEGLQNNAILSLFLDQHNNIWTGLNNGISLIAYNTAIKYITPNEENELSGYSARIFGNSLYVGTSDGAYKADLIEKNNDLSFVKSRFTPIKNSRGQVWRLNEVNGQLLMSHTSGSFLINRDIAINISDRPTWLFVPTASVYPANEIIAGTYTGLQHFSYEKERFIDRGAMEGVYESFRFLAVDNEGTIWASHPYRGIYRLQLSDDLKTYSSLLMTESKGLPSALDNHVFYVKNRVVFATSRGVYEFDKKKDRFIRSAFLDPILNETPVRYLQEDNEGNIWFCSGKQMGMIHWSDKKEVKPQITYFPEITGQILSGFENVYPYNRENIFIASEKGIIHINLNKYRNNRAPRSVILGVVKGGGAQDSTYFGGYYKVGEENLSPDVPSSTRSFHFEFSSPAFAIQNTIEYSYYLEGFDDDWSQWTTRTEKDYTNLSNGNYTFKVKARDNLGNESEIRSYNFYIEAPWYKSWWAYIIYTLLVAAAIYWLGYFQRQKLKKQEIRFEREQQQLQLLHQLELEKSEKEIIQLQNEKLVNEVMFKNRELADTNLHLVERSEALHKVQIELQKLYKKSGENHDIKKTLQLLHEIEKNNSNWENFATHFDEVNNNFLNKLKSMYPKLTNNDLKVCAYLQLNLSSKEIAQMMNISVRGVEISRYRLRKKLELPSERSLIDFLNAV